VAQARIRQHLAETQLQKKRMAQRLEAYGRQPNAIKSAVSNLMGNLVGITSGLRGDVHARMMRDDYVTEHLEIAAYTYLITTARLLGDQETVAAAELTLKEEIAMAEWLAQHLNDGLVKDFHLERIALPELDRPLDTPHLTVAWEPASGAVGTERR